MGLLEGFSDIQKDRSDTGKQQQALESLFMKQLLMASGAFKGSEGQAGGSLHAELFAEALADAVTQSGAFHMLPSATGSGSAAPTSSHGSGSLLSSAIPTGHMPGTSGSGTTSGASSASTLAALADVTGGQGHVTSNFGSRADPFTGQQKEHDGVDVGLPEGSDILAAADGVVKRVGNRGGYGEAVEVDHGGGVTTLYAHASELLVHEGEKVHQGEPIAKVGHTGRATGDHLHFEVRVDGRATDPSRALKAYGQRADKPFTKEP